MVKEWLTGSGKFAANRGGNAVNGPESGDFRRLEPVFIASFFRLYGLQDRTGLTQRAGKAKPPGLRPAVEAKVF